MIDTIRYVRAVRRHARLVVATSIVAVVLSILVLFFLPQQYRATADVVVLVPDVQTGSVIASSAQAVSDFEGALRSEVVARAAADDAGIPASSIGGGLQTEWLEGGALVEVTFTGKDPGSAEAAVFTASKEAIVFLLESRLAPVSQRLKNAQAAIASANQAVTDFTVENELLDVDGYLERQQERLDALQRDRTQALIDGDTDEADLIQGRITSLLQTTSDIRTEYNALQAAREAAAASLTEARAAHDTAQAAVDAAQAASSVRVLSAEPVPRTERLPSQLLVVVVIATALTIGLIVLLELLTPRRRVIAEASGRGRHMTDVPPKVGRADVGEPVSPGPVRRPAGGAETRGADGGRSPAATVRGSGSAGGTRAAPTADATARPTRPAAAPSPDRSEAPTDATSRPSSHDREGSALPPPPSRPVRPVTGGADGPTAQRTARPGAAGGQVSEGARRRPVDPAQGRTAASGGDAAGRSPRPPERSDEGDARARAESAGRSTPRSAAPAGPAAAAKDGAAGQGAQTPDPARQTGTTSGSKKRSKKRKRRSTAPAAERSSGGTPPDVERSNGGAAPVPAPSKPASEGAARSAEPDHASKGSASEPSTTDRGRATTASGDGPAAQDGEPTGGEDGGPGASPEPSADTAEPGTPMAESSSDRNDEEPRSDGDGSTRRAGDPDPSRNA